jgi:hypothetical protein
MGQIHLTHFKHFCYIENAKLFEKSAKGVAHPPAGTPANEGREGFKLRNTPNPFAA